MSAKIVAGICMLLCVVVVVVILLNLAHCIWWRSDYSSYVVTTNWLLFPPSYETLIDNYAAQTGNTVDKYSDDDVKDQFSLYCFCPITGKITPYLINASFKESSLDKNQQQLYKNALNSELSLYTTGSPEYTDALYKIDILTYLGKFM